MPTVYLASGLGFSHELKSYRDKIKVRLAEIGCSVLDPWEQPFHGAIQQALSLTDWPARVDAFGRVARQIGKSNEAMIRECDAILGVLDGWEIDSGVASEIGYAAALGKPCYGLRTNFRDCGDFDGIPINLQVLYWIEASGGRMFGRVEEIEFD
jgi:nucleoside 2-deoxyribosyltransferase